MVSNNEFTTDLDFQEYVQSIFQKTFDAHTRYQKPKCYSTVFVQPFAFNLTMACELDDLSCMPLSGKSGTAVAQQPKLFLMENLFTAQYSSVYPDVDVVNLIGQEIVLLNGVEFTTEISSWSDSYEYRSNNPSVRFNSALRSYLYRSAVSLNILPMSDLSITFTNGVTVSIPWMVTFTTGLANVSICEAQPLPVSTEKQVVKQASNREKVQLLETKSSSLEFASRPHVHLEEAPIRFDQETLHASRDDRIVIIPTNSTYYISCFLQTVDGDSANTALVSQVLVMKVASFSPPGSNYLDAWQGFLGEAQQCLSVEFDMLVVDVMANGGGYVSLSCYWG